MEEASLADELFVINEGKLLAKGTPVEVFSKRELLKNAGLEAPQASNLVNELKKSGIDIDVSGVIDTDSAVRAIEAAFEKSGIRPQTRPDTPKGAQNA